MNPFISFVILISVLIFVHEFGHFITGKLLGVKVLTFSIGFPPRLIGRRFGETEYVIGAIPFGGYVKFLGEDTPENISHEELRRAFHTQPIWKRLLIVLAGPTMNLIFPIALYFVIFSTQTKIISPVIGTVLPGGGADKAGLMAGDRIIEMDGKKIYGFEDLRDVAGRRSGKKVKVVVLRNGKRIEKMVEIQQAYEILPLQIKEKVGRIGINSAARRAVVQVTAKDSIASKAGIKTGDIIVSIGGKKIARIEQLIGYSFAAGEQIEVKFLRPVKEKKSPIGFSTYHLVQTTLDTSSLVRICSRRCNLSQLGLESSELYVDRVSPGSVAQMIGIAKGDKIIRFDGKDIILWDQMRTTLRHYPEAYHTITVKRPDGTILEATFKMSRKQFYDELKIQRIKYEFGAYNYCVYAPAELIPNPNPISRAVRGAFRQLYLVIKYTFIGIVQIIRGQISAKSLGGPIMIFDIAAKAGKRGTADFIGKMAFISINLGIVNLVPIPLLDGGLVLLLLFEAVMRRKPGEKFKLIYQYIGLALIGFLVIFVVTNDIERYWESIAKFFKKLL